MGMKEFEIPEDLAKDTGISGSITLKSFTLGNVKVLNELRGELRDLKNQDLGYDDEDYALLAIERILSTVIVKLPEGVDSVLDLDWPIVEWLLPIVEEYSLPLAQTSPSKPATPSVSEPKTKRSKKC